MVVLEETEIENICCAIYHAVIHNVFYTYDMHSLTPDERRHIIYNYL